MMVAKMPRTFSCISATSSRLASSAAAIFSVRGVSVVTVVGVAIVGRLHRCHAQARAQQGAVRVNVKGPLY
jgi:hypothetical protein